MDLFPKYNGKITGNTHFLDCEIRVVLESSTTVKKRAMRRWFCQFKGTEEFIITVHIRKRLYSIFWHIWTSQLETRIRNDQLDQESARRRRGALWVAIQHVLPHSLKYIFFFKAWLIDVLTRCLQMITRWRTCGPSREENFKCLQEELWHLRVVFIFLRFLRIDKN